MKSDEILTLLPKRPSLLLETALRDLEGLDSELYRPDYGTFHSGKGRGSTRCTVCLAGGVIAQSLGVPPQSTYLVGDVLYDLEVRNQAQIWALDAMRLGNWALAFDRLGLPIDEVPAELLEREPLFPTFSGWAQAFHHIDWQKENVRILKEAGW